MRIDFIDTLAQGKKYIWNYGDPSSPKQDTTFAPNNSTFHVYNSQGIFRVMLISIDSLTCNISDTVGITVKGGE